MRPGCVAAEAANRPLNDKEEVLATKTCPGLLRFVMLLWGLGAAALAGGVTASKPNFLLIVADDKY